MMKELSETFHYLRYRLYGLRNSLIALLLLVTMSACSGSNPTSAILKEAISLEFQLTQNVILGSIQLINTPLNPTIRRIQVVEQEDIQIGDSRGLHISGRLDWHLQGDREQINSPFDIYLQRGERGESLRLARAIGGDGENQLWRIYPLGLKDI
tara:strand:- start:344 stop:805 length:462 start_codon:yes stop_codon:yes gene_type:complete